MLPTAIWDFLQLCPMLAESASWRASAGGQGCGSWAGPGLRGRETRVLTALQSSAWAAQGRWLSSSELAQQAHSLFAARATVHLSWGSRLTETRTWWQEVAVREMWIQNSQIVFVCTIKQLVVCWVYAFWFSGIRRQGMKRSCCHNEKEQVGNLKELSQYTTGESAISVHSGTHVVPWYHHQWHGKMHLHWKGTGSNFKIYIYLSFSFIQ